MKSKYSLFSQVALAGDLPEYNLKRGDIATIVEHYPMPEGEEDGYSLEGFDVPQVTLEVAASQIIPITQLQQEEMILVKLRQLSEARLLQLEDFLDFLFAKTEFRGRRVDMNCRSPLYIVGEPAPTEFVGVGNIAGDIKKLSSAPLPIDKRPDYLSIYIHRAAIRLPQIF